MKKALLLLIISIFILTGFSYGEYEGTYEDQAIMFKIMPIIDAANCVQKDNFHDAIYKYLGLYYKKHPSHNIQFIEELGGFGENTVDSRLEYMLYSLDYLVRYSGNKWLETNHPDKLHAMDSRIDEGKEYYGCQVLSLPMTGGKPPRIEGRRKANLDALLDL